MIESRILMGMPITVEILDHDATAAVMERTFAYFQTVDNRFSTYKSDSEISQINARNLTLATASDDMKEIFRLAEQTKHETDGYFDIQKPDGTYDPSGIVKGWAIYEAAKQLRELDIQNFYIDAGGDIQADGLNAKGEKWRVGIRNPFSNDPQQACIKVVLISNCGVATSGTYLRGDHIYNPKQPNQTLHEVVSLTVIGPNVYEADRFATAAFAMGKKGIEFIERLPGFEGYQVDAHGIATMTTGFPAYVGL